MKATNLGGTIAIEGNYSEVSKLTIVLERYVIDNPDSDDVDLVKEWLHELRNPRVN